MRTPFTTSAPIDHRVCGPARLVRLDHNDLQAGVYTDSLTITRGLPANPPVRTLARTS